MRVSLAALALAAALPAQAALLFWREPSDARIRPAQELFDQRRHREVVGALTPEFMQSLRGTDLRQAYILLGESLDALGRPDEALGVFQLGAKLFPKNVDLLTRLGGSLHRAGLDEQARPAYLKALSYEPRHFGAHHGLARIDRGLGFLERAADHYEAALETLGGDASVWREYAETLLAQRDWRTAALALERARSIEPENAEGLVLTAFALRAQGDLAGAVEAMDLAAARAPPR
jgi:tetratricopeptide (TPR) repeat protein